MKIHIHLVAERAEDDRLHVATAISIDSSLPGWQEEATRSIAARAARAAREITRRAPSRPDDGFVPLAETLPRAR